MIVNADDVDDYFAGTTSPGSFGGSMTRWAASSSA